MGIGTTHSFRGSLFQDAKHREVELRYEIFRHCTSKDGTRFNTRGEFARRKQKCLSLRPKQWKELQNARGGTRTHDLRLLRPEAYRLLLSEQERDRAASCEDSHPTKGNVFAPRRD